MNVAGAAIVAAILANGEASAPTKFWWEKQGCSSFTHDVPVLRRTSGPEPLYPSELLKGRVSGHASVSMLVAANGGVLEVRIIAASHKLFGQTAKDAVQRWTFPPRPTCYDQYMRFDFVPD
jgi:TonB family protein